MPLMKKPYRKKRVMRKKRAPFRMVRKARVARSTNFLTTKRTWHIEPQENLAATLDIIYDATGGIWYNTKGQTRTFQLSDVPSYTEFTSLFDSYRIKGVKYQFVPVFNEASVQPTTFATPSDRYGLPMINYVIDQDGPLLAPTSENQLLEYATCKRMILDKQKSIYIRNPRVEIAVGTGVTATAAEGKAGQWIDCSAPNVEHYGLKYWIPEENLSKSVAIRVYITYYLQFKRVI